MEQTTQQHRLLAPLDGEEADAITSRSASQARGPKEH